MASATRSAASAPNDGELEGPGAAAVPWRSRTTIAVAGRVVRPDGARRAAVGHHRDLGQRGLLQRRRSLRPPPGSCCAAPGPRRPPPLPLTMPRMTSTLSASSVRAGARPRRCGPLASRERRRRRSRRRGANHDVAELRLAVPSPPFMPPKPRPRCILPTVAPAPAPTLPSATGPVRRAARLVRGLGIGPDLRIPTARSSMTAPNDDRDAQTGRAPVEAELRSSKKRITPALAGSERIRRPSETARECDRPG